MKKEELQAIRERIEQILTWSGEGGDIRHSDNWSEQRLRLLSLLEEDVPKLLDEIEQLREALKNIKYLVANREKLRPLMSEHNIWNDIEQVARQALGDKS